MFITTLMNSVANVLEGEVAEQIAVSVRYNAFGLDAQIRPLENSGVEHLPPANTGKDDREHGNKRRRNCRDPISDGHGGPHSRCNVSIALAPACMHTRSCGATQQLRTKKKLRPGRPELDGQKAGARSGLASLSEPLTQVIRAHHWSDFDLRIQVHK
jgi:hypothetical protein